MGVSGFVGVGAAKARTGSHVSGRNRLCRGCGAARARAISAPRAASTLVMQLGSGSDSGSGSSSDDKVSRRGQNLRVAYERSSAAESQSHPEEKAGFRRRNLFSLRAIGDGASTVLLYDFLTSLADGCVTFSIDMFGQQNALSGPSNTVFAFHEYGLELLIGAALGVATVKTLLQTTLNRKREQDEQRGVRLGKEAAVIAKEWNIFLNSIDYMLDCANLLSVGRIAKQNEVMTEDDVDTALMWMETMEEYEGDMAINMLRKLEKSPIQSVRLRLARGLGLLNARSNIIEATLARLKQDSDFQVRNVAEAALQQYLKKNNPHDDNERDPTFAGIVHSLVAVQEVQSDGENAAFVAMRGGLKDSPVDKMDVLDVHTLCVVSALALAAEITCVVLNQPIPFRFLGVGWVLAVAGLAVYPYSSQAWQRLLVPVKIQRSSSPEDDAR